jgi:hypothetical protein
MNDPTERLWRSLAGGARHADAIASAPDDPFIAQVLSRRRLSGNPHVAPAWESRLTTGITWLALAASLLVALWQWPVIESAWWPQSEPWPQVVLVEP